MSLCGCKILDGAIEYPCKLEAGHEGECWPAHVVEGEKARKKAQDAADAARVVAHNKKQLKGK